MNDWLRLCLNREQERRGRNTRFEKQIPSMWTALFDLMHEDVESYNEAISRDRHNQARLVKRRGEYWWSLTDADANKVRAEIRLRRHPWIIVVGPATDPNLRFEDESEIFLKERELRIIPSTEAVPVILYEDAELSLEQVPRTILYPLLFPELAAEEENASLPAKYRIGRR